MATLSDCMTPNPNNAQGCYDLSIDQNKHLTKSAQWEIQNKAIDAIDSSNKIMINVGSGDRDPDLTSYNYIKKDDCPVNDSSCITKDQWTNLKLLKAFTDNYQEWKSQEEAAIQKEITEYNNRITAVTSKVDSMLASLDRMESEAGNKAKQQHMLTELSGMLSTYDRKMDIEESERVNTNSRIKNLSNTFKIIAGAILLCIFVMMYVKRQKGKSLKT